nr:hypothetical protein [Caldilineaceae bacterium]
MRRIALRRHASVLVVLTLASLVLTWPLTRYFTSHMPGNGIDDPSLGWNLWWVKHQLVDQLTFDIFHAGWMFHPIAINLAFYTLTPLNGLLSVPLQSAFSLVIANNLLVLSSFVLGGYGTFLLVRDLLAKCGGSDGAHNMLAATIAAFVYAFAAPKLFYVALGQYNIASSQWIPFCVLYVLRIGRSADLRQALRNGALAALFLIFQAWAELTYASFLLIFIAIYFLWLAAARLHAQFTTRNLQFIILPFLVMAVLFGLGLAPFLWAMLPDMRAEGDFFTSGGGFSDVFSADLAGYLVPTRLHPLVGDWVAGLPFPNDVGQQIFIGYAVLAVAVLGLIALLRHSPLAIRNSPFTIHNSPWFWPLVTLFFWWMTLGPRLRWLGQETAIPGPFALISLLPFFNGNRYPSRYSVMVLLGVAVLVGFGCQAILTYFSKRRIEAGRLKDSVSPTPISSSAQSPTRYQLVLAVGLVALLLFEHLAIPLPLNDFRVPALYQTLAAQPGDFSVLELPTGWRNGARVLGRSDKLIMMQQWYQTVHGKRRL